MKVKTFYMCIVFCAVFFGFVILESDRFFKYEEELGFTEYTLRLYYLGGSQCVKKYTTIGSDQPYIYSSYGCYTLKGVPNEEKGVVRFEILDKRNIPYQKMK